MSAAIPSLANFDAPSHMHTSDPYPTLSTTSSSRPYIVSSSQKSSNEIYFSPKQLQTPKSHNDQPDLFEKPSLQSMENHLEKAAPLTRSTSSQESCASNHNMKSNPDQHSALSSASALSSGSSNQANSSSISNPTIADTPIFVKKQNLYSTVDPTQRFFDQDLNLTFQSDPRKFLGKSLSTDGTYAISREFIDSKSDCRVKLYYSHFQPLTCRPKAQILVVHGFCEHSGLYINFSDYFVRQGFAVHLYDQRGFGYSGGISRNNSTEEFHSDFAHILGQTDPSLPLYVYGHSTGTLGALTFFMLNPHVTITGFISLNAFTKIPKYFNLTNNKKWILRFLLLFYEDLLINSKINLSALCKNSYHIKKLIKDEHIQPHLTLRMASSLIEQCEFLAKNCHQISMPILLLHGKQDVVTKYQNSLDLFQGISSSDKECKIIEDGFHQPHLDTSAASLHQVMNSWLQSKLASKPTQLMSNSFNIGS